MYPREAVITGEQGRLTWQCYPTAGYPAADVVGFTLTTLACRRDGPWQLQATLVNVNAFNVAQTPLVFVVPRKTGDWCWPVTAALERHDAFIVARLGPPQYVRTRKESDAPVQVCAASHRTAAYLGRRLA